VPRAHLSFSTITSSEECTATHMDDMKRSPRRVIWGGGGSSGHATRVSRLIKTTAGAALGKGENATGFLSSYRVGYCVPTCMRL
jgi:hypothetical protein